MEGEHKGREIGEVKNVIPSNGKYGFTRLIGKIVTLQCFIEYFCDLTTKSANICQRPSEERKLSCVKGLTASEVKL